jgi:hypothetical protein
MVESVGAGIGKLCHIFAVLQERIAVLYSNMSFLITGIIDLRLTMYAKLSACCLSFGLSNGEEAIFLCLISKMVGTYAISRKSYFYLMTGIYTEHPR